MPPSLSADDVKLEGSFETVKRQLQGPEFASRLSQPLAFWALPNDRRLPLAFLGHTVEQILATPFQQLSATAGIGRKKMESLVILLVRATKDDPAAYPLLSSDTSIPDVPNSYVSGNFGTDPFDPTKVSELVWSKWRDTVAKHGVGSEKLGRLAPSLRQIPTVIWDTPLGFYLDKSLTSIRQLKTHGEKRVRVVLEVFHTVHQILTPVNPESGLSIRVAPRFVTQIENWILQARASESPVEHQTLAENLAMPIIQQLLVDAGSTVSGLVEGRLGVRGPVQNVREQAKQMGVTRARVYQLLEECSRVMAVRWPEGRRQLDELAQRMDELYSPADAANLIGNLRELLFPFKYDAVADVLIASPGSLPTSEK